MASIEMTRIDLRNRALGAAQLRAALPRGGVDVEAVLSAVRPVVEGVALRGAEAALEYGESFDGVRPDAVRVPPARLNDALGALAPAVRAALEVAIERARAVHADQRRVDTTTTLGPGATVTERWVAVARVGLYVPGGNAVYPSSVVMNVVPAQIAGVGSLVVATPPQARFGGLPHPTILAAARLLGVEEVWAVGGAQGIALLAQLETTVHRARVTAALAGRQSAIVLVDDIDAGVQVVNTYAPEHLEIQTAEASRVAGRIRSAGAVFVGPYSPVSLGDYCAGSNHVLPTAGCARHSSGLSVQTFLRGIHVVEYDEAALKDVSGHVIMLAQAEDLPAHGEAVRRRFER